MAVALLHAGGVSGCRRAEPPVLLDLAAQLPFADREAPWTQVAFGTASARPHEVRGFVPEAHPPGDTFSWMRRRVIVRLAPAGPPAPRALVLDIAPHPQTSAQSIDAEWNDVPIGGVALSTGRARYRLEVPLEAQRPGENTLVLRASQLAPVVDPHAGRLAAALFGLALGARDDAGLAALTEPSKPPAVGVQSSPSGPSLVQAGPTSLRFAFRAPERAELRVAVRRGTGPRDAPVQFAVTVDTAHAGPRVLREQALAPGSEREEIAVALDVPAGEATRVSLEARTPGSWLEWNRPRIVGGAASPPAAPGPPSPADAAAPVPAGLAQLRRELTDGNVVLFILDAAGAAHFPTHGYDRRTTPHIARLAEEGVVFERFYTPAVFTLAAMSSVWTSRYPDEHHAGVEYSSPLPASRTTLAERLSAHGVVTAGFTANAMAGSPYGLDRGFGEFDDVYKSHRLHTGEVFLSVVPAWLQRHAGHRFFLYVHIREPHSPYDPPAPFDTRFGPEGPLSHDDRVGNQWITRVNAGRHHPSEEEVSDLVRLYDGNLAFADDVVGRLRAALEASGAWEHTAVLVAADHGEQLYEHGFVGHGEQLYEQSAWVPLVMRLPARAAPRGVRRRGLADLLDVAPTVADLFGLADDPALEQAFRGRSLLSQALGGTGDDAVFTQTTGDTPRYSVRDDAFCYMFDSRWGGEELYDLATDPREDRNLVSARPVIAAYYRQRLWRWLASLDVTPGEPSSAPRQLDEATLENLRALGYVQ